MPQFSVRRAALCASLLALGLSAQAEVQVDQARVRAVPPGSSNSAAYLDLHNRGTASVALERVESSAAQAVELHQVQEQAGMLRMSPVASIEVSAGAQVSLKPGGYHIMLLGITQPLQEGQNVDLDLYFSDGQSLQIQAPVMRIQPMMKPGMHKHESTDAPASTAEPHHGS